MAALLAIGFAQDAQAQTYTASADYMTTLIFGAVWDATSGGPPPSLGLHNFGNANCKADTAVSEAQNAQNCLISYFGLVGPSIAGAYGVNSGNGLVPVMTGTPDALGALMPYCSGEFTPTGANYVIQHCSLWFLDAPPPYASPLKALAAPSAVPGNALVGDSVVTSYGSYFEAYPAYSTPSYGEVQEVPGDIAINPNSLGFQYFYNSGRPNAGGVTGATSLGAAWSHNFDSYLHFNSESGSVMEVFSITAELPGGQSISFTPDSTGAWTPDADMDYTLTESGSGSTATWTLVGPEGTANKFNAQGYWQSRTMPDGYAYTATYNSTNQLSVVADSTGRKLQFNYDQNGLLTTVTTPDNVITFTFKNGQLGAVTYSSTASPNSTPYQEYFYDNANQPFFMTSRTTNGVTDLTLQPDIYGRVASVQNGDSTAAATTYDLSIAPGIVTVTDPSQAQTQITFTQVLDLYKPTQIGTSANPNGTTPWQIAYDSNGFVNDIKYANSETTYVNTTYGLPIKTIQNLGSSNRSEVDVTPDKTFPMLPDKIVYVGDHSVTFNRYPTGVPYTVTQVDLTGKTTGAAATTLINIGADSIGEVTSAELASTTKRLAEQWMWGKGVLQKQSDTAGDTLTATTTSPGGYWLSFTTPVASITVERGPRMGITRELATFFAPPAKKSHTAAPRDHDRKLPTTAFDPTTKRETAAPAEERTPAPSDEHEAVSSEVVRRVSSPPE